MNNWGNNQKKFIDKIFLEEDFYPSWSESAPLYKVRIEIGGLGITINTTNHKLSKKIEEEYEIFISSKDETDLFIDVQVKEVPSEIEGDIDLVVDTYEEKTFFVRRPFFAGIVNFEQRRAKLNLLEENAAHIEDALRFLTPHFLPSLKGMLLHASSIVRSQKGFIFCGKSGVGKTTIARLSNEMGYTILTDEISLIREINRNYKVFSTPYWGEMGDLGEGVKK